MKIKKSTTRPLLRVVGLAAVSIGTGCVAVTQMKNNITSAVARDESIILQGQFVLHKDAPKNWGVRILITHENVRLIDKDYAPQEYPQSFTIKKEELLAQNDLPKELVLQVYYIPPEGADTDHAFLPQQLTFPTGRQNVTIELERSEPIYIGLPGNPRDSLYFDPTEYP